MLTTPEKVHKSYLDGCAERLHDFCLRHLSVLGLDTIKKILNAADMDGDRICTVSNNLLKISIHCVVSSH